MKITINTDVLKRYHLTLGEFLVLLLGSYDIDIAKCQESLIQKKMASKDLFRQNSIVLSNNDKNLLARILMQSDDKAIKSGLDFEDLAQKLQEIYPSGIKAGKTYSWRGEVDEIAQKLRTLIIKYDFNFTEEEAVEATKEYCSSFNPPYKNMHILKNFLLFTKKDKAGHWEINSMFMTLVENLREEKQKL